MILQSLKAKHVVPVIVTIPTDKAEGGNENDASVSNSMITTATTTPSATHVHVPPSTPLGL
jgi:hypothetical protein